MQSVNWIDHLKIRASAGQSGNDAVGNFDYLSGYSVLGSRLFDEGQLPGLYVTGQDMGGLYDSTYDLLAEGSASSFALSSGRIAVKSIFEENFSYSISNSLESNQ